MFEIVYALKKKQQQKITYLQIVYTILIFFFFFCFSQRIAVGGIRMFRRLISVATACACSTIFHPATAGGETTTGFAYTRHIIRL